MATAKEIKQRIRSIKNTEKTTKAMELVAAAKMRRAIQSAVSAEAYYTATWNIVRRVSYSVLSLPEKKRQDWNELLRFFGEETPVDEISADEHVTMIVFASNRGLCGAYNSHVVKKAAHFLKNRNSENTTVITVGKKAATMLSSLGVEVSEVFVKDDRAVTDESIQAIATEAYQAFAEGKTQRVLIAYSDFISPIVNEPVIHQLYPLSNTIEETAVNEDAHSRKIAESETAESTENVAALTDAQYEFLYEPTPRRVLEFMIPRIGQVELYQALLESNAAEHSSRMLAMKNATDAAKDMAKELVLVYNRARQAAITKEIAEIAAGASALE